MWGNSGKSKYSCPQGFEPMLPQVDVRHLYSVVILAEELNFTRAAHRLRITQSALSRQITELETQHGFQLFNRDRKRAAQLTEAGRTFVQEARSALLHADRAIHFARAAHHGYENVLLVGHAHHADQEWVSTLLTIRLPLSSGVTSKAANGGQFKTGQREWPGTRLFYSVAS